MVKNYDLVNPGQNIPKYYSLAELSASIESVIAKTYRNSYWVKAEIAKLNYYPKSGHCYPDLVEKKDGIIMSQIRGTIWSGYFSDINKKFISVTREPLSDGMTVLFLAKVTYNAVYGLSLQITDIEPSFTLGEMAKEKSLSIEKLKKEGLFNNNKRLTTPLLIRRIAVISVETSKGYHDFKKTIDNNDWNYKFFHMLFPAVLQGETAITSITEQLKIIKKVSHHFDAVTIIRGGGGDIGLSSYDSFKLSSEVASFPLPIITGIGHATNETVVEMVAWANKITPTDVAYFLIQKYHNFFARIESAENAIVEFSSDLLNANRNSLWHLSVKLKSSAEAIVNRNQSILHHKSINLNYSTSQFIEEKKQLLKDFSGKLSLIPMMLISDNKHNLEKLHDKILILTKASLVQSSRKINTIEEKLKLLNPKNILKRGYSITLKDGKPVIDTALLTVGDELETIIFNGKVKSKISEITENNKS